MRRIFAVALVGIGIIVAASGARADSLSFGFSLEPAGGAITGSPGSTIGWGYDVTNNSASDFLLLSAVNSLVSFDPKFGPEALIGVAAGNPPPLLAPGASQTVFFNASPLDLSNQTGLFELALSPNAPLGTLTGQFDLTGDFFDSGFNFVEQTDEFANFSARVVPEPSTIFLLASGLVLCWWVTKRLSYA
jgi:hypothetical protein